MEPLGALAFCIPLTMGQIPPATAVVDAYVEAFNARDIETMRELVSEDARFNTPDGVETGAEALARYEEQVFERGPKASLHKEQSMHGGDLVAQIETLVSGGKAVTWLSVYRLDRGCIVGLDTSWQLDGDSHPAAPEDSHRLVTVSRSATVTVIFSKTPGQPGGGFTDDRVSIILRTGSLRRLRA